MAPRHYLRCLGQPALFAATGELIRFRTKKHLALLVYLAIESDQQHRRDRLAELLARARPIPALLAKVTCTFVSQLTAGARFTS